jgi:hypothetical protein
LGAHSALVARRTQGSFALFAKVYPRLKERSRLTRQKISYDGLGPPNANLDMIPMTQAGVGVKRLSFDEKSPHRVERRQASILSKLMQRFQDSAIKAASA